MSSPSSARINASSSKIRSSKRDANPGASRSRAFGASSVSNSSRVVAGTGGGNGGGGGRSAARVYMDGADVTPQSLLVSRIKPSSSHDQRSQNKAKSKSGTRKAGGTGSSVMGASVILNQDHLSASSIDDSDSDAPSPAPPNQKAKPSATSVAKPAATATGIPAVSATATATSTPEQEEDGAAEGDGGTDATATKMLGDLGQSSSMVQAVPVVSQTPRVEKKPRYPMTIYLGETPTAMLFELRSLCVAQDASFHQAVAIRNRQYLETCAAKKGSDKFVEGRSQTLQLAQKTKEVMTAPPATRDSACTATDWDIFDCVRVEDDSANDHDDSSAMEAASSSATSAAGSSSSTSGQGKAKPQSDPTEIGEAMLKQQVNEIVEATTASPGCMLDVDGDIVDDLRARQHALRHARKHRHGGAHGTTSSSFGNSQKSRVLRHGSSTNNQSSQDYGRSTANFGNSSSSSMASPTQSSGNVSFGASQDVVSGGGGLGGGDDSSASNSVANSQVGFSGGASRVLSNGSDDAKQSQNAYARANANVDLGETIATQRTRKVLASESLLKTVSVVERAVQQNVYHHQHVLYRNFPSLTPSSAANGAMMAGSSSMADPFRKGLTHDWRAGIGLGAASDPLASTTSSGGGALDIVPPISSFNAVATGLLGNSGSGSAAMMNSGRSAAMKGLEQLWAFQCCLTQGRTVTCLAWNTVNEDLLAVAYANAAERPECPSPAAMGAAATSSAGASSAPSSQSKDDGLVLFWSLKNPEFPERIYNLDVGVTSIDFSRAHPYMLAVGFANGVVAIYDTRKDDAQQPVVPTTTGAAARPPTAPTTTDATAATATPAPAATVEIALRRYVPVPVATSETSSGKHLDAVWQVKWISKGTDRGENVVSISSDGRVTEWSMKKGLSFSDLMTLKRVANPLLGSDARGDGGVISRQASGHCIDFAPHDPSVYYVGTEDGIIHKCSVSYNEQYLQTYFGHTGPVYQILVSPFSSDLFLSCSADWNVKLWHQGDQKEALNFRSVNLQHAVLSISWCPSHSTIFGTVTEDGRIEIWDLQHSSLDPIITHYPKKYAPVACIPLGGGGPKSAGAPPGTAAGSGFDASLDDQLSGGSTKGADTGQQSDQQQQQLQPPREIALECTKIAFAPSVPVIVVGDSTGDVTVYRVPALTDGARAEPLSHDEQVARLRRAMNPNNQD